MARTWWKDDDLYRLAGLYSTASDDELLLAFPDRTMKSIQRRAHRMGLRRENVNHSFPKGDPDVYPEDVDRNDIRDIPEAPGYAVTRDGRAWSKKNGIWLKLGANAQGYLCILPCVNGKNCTMYIHKLVCRLFNGESPFEGAIVRHLNSVNTDNRAENLAWGTYADNQQDRIANDTYQYGEKNPASFLTEEIVRNIRSDYDSGIRQVDLMDRYSLQRGAVWAIVHRKVWRHI